MTGPLHLITFKVEGRAHPWKVSRVGTKPGPLVLWQDRVAFAARKLWGFGRAPYTGPVGASFWFYMRPADMDSHEPDLTNLVKGTEDALQGVVIANDRRVRASHGEIITVALDAPERAFVELWALGGLIIDDPADPETYGFRPWQWGLSESA
jgi:hypothetical protein